jgi:tryptophan aminotransferase
MRAYEIDAEAYNQTASICQHASSLSQAITFAVLNSWGYDGFIRHTQNVSEFYLQKCIVFDAAMRQHLDGLAEWTVPGSGMFFWCAEIPFCDIFEAESQHNRFKLLLSDDPSDEGDSEWIIRSEAYKEGVLALPGTDFYPNGGKSAYVRVSFSILDEDNVNEALRRLRVAILRARGSRRE